MQQIPDETLHASDGVQGRRDGSQAVAVQYQAVSKTFGATQALRAVTFEVNVGEIHAVVGENGAGKSTLVGLTSGRFSPDAGTVVVFGQVLNRADPRESKQIGVATVRQDPSLFPDLTVAENLWLSVSTEAVPRSRLRDWAAAVLAAGISFGALSPTDTVENLTMEERYVVELAAALFSRPRLLLLDEPTEHLSAHRVSELFERLEELAAQGTAIIYISHRLPDVLRLADRVTILRNGERIATVDAVGYPVEELVSMVAGRNIGSVFPAKPIVETGAATVLNVAHLSGSGFADIDLRVPFGEIVGIAGIEGNGQREFLRALAGLCPYSGTIEICGNTRRRWTRPRSAAAGVEYVSRDRRSEGLFSTLSVLENLRLFERPGHSRLGFVRQGYVASAGDRTMEQYNIRARSGSSAVSSLSGGNAQKTVIARTLSRKPKLLLLDEPTQGVDVGARGELYRDIRSAADAGAAVLIASSDATELVGLCHRVLVFSRGRVVRELVGNTVTELDIVSGAVTDDSYARASVVRRGARKRKWKLWAALLLLNVIVAVLGNAFRSDYLTEQNIGFVLGSLTTLAFVAMAQQALLFFGGIDLSVGPLAGLVLIIGSFTLTGSHVPVGNIIVMIVLCVTVMTVIGVFNWFLGDVVGLSAFVGTLVTYVLLQAVAQSARPTPSGYIPESLEKTLSLQVGPFPVATIVCAAIAIFLEMSFFLTRRGAAWRAVGSSEESAALVGLRPSRIRLGAYFLAALLAIFAGSQLLTQVGVGINTAGVSYSLSSITAVVVGGATLAGGRGSFIGAFLGALLVEQALSLTSFLNLGSASQFYFLGGLILLAALVALVRSFDVDRYRVRGLILRRVEKVAR